VPKLDSCFKNCTSSKFAAARFALLFGVQFKRQKLIKMRTYMKIEACKLYSNVFTVSAKYHQNRYLSFPAIPFPSQCIFSETQCTNKNDSVSK